MFERTVSLWRRVVDGRHQKRKPLEKAVAEEDRRIWVRYPCDAELTCQPAHGAEPTQRLAARARNISLGGISLVVCQPFQPGNMLTIEIPGSTPQSSTTVLACVIHVINHTEGEWILGCNFSAELTADELEQFGAARQRTNGSDLRTWQRFQSQTKAEYQVATDEADTLHQARVLNLSPNGIGILVDQEISNGTLLSLKLQGSHHQPPVSVLACVVHVMGGPTGGWSLGCNFITELDDDMLHELV